jgi:MFS transporter, ACS family, hexuronate transporter
MTMGFWSLVMMRVLLGVTESPSFPGSVQTIQRALPPNERSSGFGLLYTGTSIGAAIAPPLAFLLLKFFGWRGAFFGSALIGMIWVPLWLYSTRLKAAQKLLDTAPVVASTSKARTAGARIYWEAIRHKAVTRGMLVILATAPIMAFSLFWTAFFLVKTFKMTAVGMASVLWIPPVCFDLGSMAFGALASRIEKNRSREEINTPHVDLFLVATCLAFTMVLMPTAPSGLFAVGLMAISMIGVGGLFTLLTSDMLSRVPQDRVSLAGGLISSSQAIVFIAANLLIGKLVMGGVSYTKMLAYMALWMVPLCIVWMMWKPPAKTAQRG